MSSTMDHAQKYFDLSNNADIESIEHMLDENITYSSDNTGIFYGKKDVMNMKQNFFASFDELIWKIHKVSEITDNIVLFDFTFLRHQKW
jgi:hypothetical protein